MCEAVYTPHDLSLFCVPVRCRGVCVCGLRSRYPEGEPPGLLPIPRAGAAKQVRHRRPRRVLIFLGPLLRGFPHDRAQRVPL